MMIILFILLISLQLPAKIIHLDAEATLIEIYKKYDTDKDKKITVSDKSDVLNEPYHLLGTDYQLRGAYQLSSLVQELMLVETKKAPLDSKKIFQNPVKRISTSIRERFWDGLTRRIDAEHLVRVIEDEKVDSDRFLYIPGNDPDVVLYFAQELKKRPELKVHLEILPPKLTEEYLAGLKNKHGLLSLKLNHFQGVPYVVPGGRFNELYGWDSYFHILGLLHDGRVDLAQGIVENLAYEIEHFGKILNANRTYYLTRSQPPFFTSMIKEVYSRLPKTKASKRWLKEQLLWALKEYDAVWMGTDRLTPIDLSRYAGFAPGIPPEVEPNHFDEILIPYAKKYHLSTTEFKQRFEAGKIDEEDLTLFFLNDRAVRESGHDTTYRWREEGKDRCSDFVTVDLNLLLYKYELDFAHLIQSEFHGELDSYEAQTFFDQAKKRKTLIRKYLWNPKENLFFDYNWKAQSSSHYLSATTFYPLWVGETPSEKILSSEEARRFVKLALKQLEQAGGLSATSEISLKTYGDLSHERQWEWPNGWAPHQMITWHGLLNYGFKAEAHRLIYKWLYMITKNAMDYHGTIPEKYDVVNRTHKVFAEYGNVGTNFEYITEEGFGWMNASYQVGLGLLPQNLRESLEKVIPPEQIWPNQ